MAKQKLAVMALLAGGCLAPLDAAGQSPFRWLNEPETWQADQGVVEMTAMPKTDFWRKTYFGYITESGHVYGRDVVGDFIATVRVAGVYADQYDQAGLMVWADDETWMKCGLEYVDGALTVSSVFTRDFSDWAGMPADGAEGPVWLRLVRKGASLTYGYSVDGETYRDVRQGYLGEADSVLVGVMAAAPEGDGFAVRFENLTIVLANAD